MLYGLTERQLARINSVLRPANQGRDGQRPRTYEDHHWVKLSSTTASSGRYPGHFYTRDADGTMTQVDEVWVSFVNGKLPSSTSEYLYARCSGFANGRPVFDVFDQTDAVAGIGQLTTLGVEIDVTDYAVAATSSTATLLTVPSNLLWFGTYYYLTTEVTGSGSKTFRADFYLRFDSTDYFIGDTGQVGNTLPSPYAIQSGSTASIRGNGITNYSGTHELKVTVNSVLGSGNLDTFTQGKGAAWFLYYELDTFS